MRTRWDTTTKRLKAGWNVDYLGRLLGYLFPSAQTKKT